MKCDGAEMVSCFGWWIEVATGLIMVEERTEYGFWVLLGLFGEAEDIGVGRFEFEW